MARPKKKESEKLVAVTGFIPGKWEEYLENIAKRSNTSKSSIISEAVRDYLTAHYYITREG